MKKSIFFLIVIFIFTVSLFAQNQILIVGNAGAAVNESTLILQNDNQTVIRFNLNELKLFEVETGYGNAFIATSGKAPLMLQEGAPELFYLTSTFIIPDLGETELEIFYGTYTDFENIEIAPSKGDLPRSIDPQTIPYEKGDVYEQDEFYPGALASLREPFIMRDVRGQSVDVYPVQYNPVTKILRVYSEITVTINNTNRTGANEFTTQRRHGTVDPQFNQIYRNLFINHPVIQERGYPTGEEGELLIICYPDFMAAMKPYVDWKRTIGRKTTMVSTATTGTTAAQIKTYISDYYNDLENNLAYVLLVGDEPQIPTNIYAIIIPDKPVPRPLPVYSDNIYGQLVGDDPYLEILIGRMSAENVAHVQTQVQRTIHYERDLTTADSWLSVGMGIAGNEFNHHLSQGHDGGENDYVHMDFIRDRLLSYGYTTVHREYVGCPDMEENTCSDIISHRINEGVGIINYCGHGDVTSWDIAFYYDIYVAEDLENAGMLPYIFSVACVNGNFTYSQGPCFAETWMRAMQNNQPTGAIATFMATIGIDWGSSMTAQDEFVNICIDLPSPYGQSAGTKRTFAGAALNAAQKMIMVHGHGRYNKKLADFNSWTVFGDPTLMFRTKTPQEMMVSYPSVFCSGMTSLTVLCDTEGALAAVSYIDDNGEVIILGTAVVAGGTAEVVFNEPVTMPVELTLAVTGFNKVTHISSLIYSHVTINNNTVWDSNTSICGEITITNGSTLTVNNCTVSLCSDAKIVVHPGSKLIVNNGTLTNSCEGEMWQGITVLGYPEKPMDERFQGYVQVINGGKIENAICGINVKGGGIVNANEANFVNNTTGVYFGYLRGQRGRSGTFAKTNFELNNNYLGGMEDFEAHIKTQSSGSVVVHGCNFSSTASNSSSRKNMGISAFNTHLDVREYCPTGMTHWQTGFCDEHARISTFFRGFSYAISAHHSGTLPNFKVRFSIFEDNFLGGIYYGGMNHSELVKNEFIVNQPYSFGMYSRFATGYKIEENIFRDRVPGLDKENTGLIISNSGSAENEVYNNIYENLYTAQQFLDKNSSRVIVSGMGAQQVLRDITPGLDLASQFTITGLQILCNRFDNNKSTDILVGSWANPKNYGNSIRENQGSMQRPAGNWFDDNPVLNIVNIDNTLSQYAINYHYDINAANAEPSEVRNAILIPTSSSNGCPSKLRLKTLDRELALAQYNDWDTEYESWLDKLLIFDGKDEEALAMVSYYSALKENLFNAIIIDALDGDEMNGNQELIMEDLRYLFTYRGNYLDYLSIMETFLAENDYNNALATLAKIYHLFAVTKEHIAELDGLQTYIHWLQQLEKDGKNIYELSDKELGYLTGYATSNIGRGVVYVNFILCEIYGICTDEDGKNSEEEAGDSDGFFAATGTISPSNFEGVPEGRGSLYENTTLHPNPTTGELHISVTGYRISNIEIFDVYGRKLSSGHPTTSLPNQKIDISHLNAGIYFVKITTNAGKVVKKVVKQ